MKYLEDSFGLIRSLHVARFVLKLRVTEKIVLPEYKGSTFRSAFGCQLRKVACGNRDAKDCEDCLMASKCDYIYLFSTPTPQETQILKGTNRISSPVVIEPPLTTQCRFESEDTLNVGLVLIGKGLEYLTYLIHVFTEIGKSGIGSGVHKRGGKMRRGRFKLIEVHDDTSGKLIYSKQENVLPSSYKVFDWNAALAESDDKTENLKLEFLTSVRFKEMQENDQKLVELKGGFSQLITHLYRRLLLLAYFHCNPWSLDDERFRELDGERSRIIRKLGKMDDVQMLESHTHWKDHDRWSSSQQTKMKLGGSMGRASFTGNLTPYLPLIYLGQYTHLGKQTMFGLGKYKVQG